MLALGEMCFEGMGAVAKGVCGVGTWWNLFLVVFVCTAYICGVGLYAASSIPCAVYYHLRVLPSLASLHLCCTKAVALAPSMVGDCYSWSCLLIKFFRCTQG